MEHLLWECTNLNNSNNNNDDDNENNGNNADSDNNASSSEDSDHSENAEDDNEDEAEENNEDADMHEYQQVLYQNMEMLQARFQDDENNGEINFFPSLWWRRFIWRW